MCEAIVEKLFNEYIANGYISEDKVFDTLQKEGVPLFDVEYICDQLLARGVIILEENADDDENDDEQADLSQIDYNAVYSQIAKLDEGLCDIVEYIREIHPPQRREWQNLLPQAQNGNLYARNRIFEMYMRVTARIALQYVYRYELSMADTLQDAFIGLLIAIDKFEFGKQDNFTTYFPFWVRQNIIRNAKIFNSVLYFPAQIKEKLLGVYELAYYHQCGKCSNGMICPNLIMEIANELGCDEKEALYYYTLLLPAKSLEILARIEHDLNHDVSLLDQGFLMDSIIEKINEDEQKKFLKYRIDLLTEKEKCIIRLRYGIESERAMTLEEVGAYLNVTRERIRQIEARAIRKITHSRYASARISTKKHMK